MNQACDHGGCSMALDNICRCKCRGKFHGAERWRNFYLPADDPRLTNPQEVIVMPRVIKTKTGLKLKEFIKK